MWPRVIDWGLVLVVAFGGTYPVVDVIRTNASSSWSFTSLALVLVLSFTLLCKWAGDAVVLRDAALDNTSVPQTGLACAVYLRSQIDKLLADS